MATYYTSSNNPRDPTTMLYLRDPLLGSNTESPGNLHNSVMMFMNNSRPYSSNNNSFQVLPSSRGPASGANHPRQDDVLPNFDAWRHAQQEQQMGVLSSNVVPGQGLSLSLGTQFGPGIQMHSSHPGLTSYTEEEMRDGNLMSQYGKSSGVIVGRTIPSSKYLKAAQQLLDEVVNVRKALKQQQSNNTTTLQNKQDDGAKNLEDQSASNPRSELSHAEKQDFQDKLTKLLSMLDEVHRRYRQYYHQMQIVVSSFDSIAGPGAAKPYSALALQTISRHFRSLRDTITAQIKATRYSLGDHDDFGNNKGVGITRLRFVDRQLRQQRALQQLGMIQQHGWRPQRGLPESSVTILRAWLFEHFLHPYPKDSDKIMLARQTGLTRSQVSNWFINARVRLWKPMVEEMYKEEIGEAELESNSSMDNLIKETNDGNRATSEDREEDLQQSASTTLTERFGPGQFMDSKFGTVPDAEMVDPTVLESFPDSMIQSDGGSYHLSELGRFGTGSGVSLTLGLQHCEGSSSSSLPISNGMHQGFFRMRGEDIYDGGPPSSVGQTTDFERMNNVNQQQHRYGSSSMYHDFVV